MKLTLYHLIAAVLAVSVALFLLSGIPSFKNADHGTDWVVGSVGWYGAQTGLVLAAALAVYALARAARRRRATH